MAGVRRRASGALTAFLMRIPVYPAEIESGDLARECGITAKGIHDTIGQLSADMPLAELSAPSRTSKAVTTYFCWPDAEARERGFRMARKIQEKRNNEKLHD